MSELKDRVFLLSGVRTPIGSFRGSLSSHSAAQLGAVAARAAIEKAGISPSGIDETIAGCALQAGLGQNIARQIAISAGVPESVPAFTVNKVCSSSLKALHLAAMAIKAADSPCRFMVTGVESMSNVPFFMPRGEIPYGGVALTDGVAKDGLEDAMLKNPMGLCAEKSAKDYGVTREESDAYAIQSYKKAAAAWRDQTFLHEVVPVVIKQRRGPDTVVEEDEEYKKLIESKVPSLLPVFLKDGSGTITAANASSLNDGAVAAVVSRGDYLPSGLSPLAEIITFAEASGLPVDFTVIPVLAVQKLLSARNLKVEDIALWEVNEAFSVTAIAFIKALKIDSARVNIKGGAVAIGHPLGMSGLRIVVSLAHSLQPGQLGIAAICNGGGEAMAVLLQKPQGLSSSL